MLSLALGLGARRSIGPRSLTFAEMFRWEDMEPRTVTLTGTAGRAYMTPEGNFAFTTDADQVRPHYEDELIAGYYLQPASTYIGANAQATALTGANAITTVSGTSGGTPVPAEAGGNTKPDRFGTTGKCLVIPQRSTASGERQWQGATASVVSGDRVRLSTKFQIGNTPSGSGTFSFLFRATSGSISAGRYLLTLNADGTVSTTLGSTANPDRGGIEVLEERDGKPVYMLWQEVVASGTATIYSAFLEPNAAVGAEFIFHDCPAIEVNPTAPPNPLPIGGTKTYAADSLAIGTSGEFFAADMWRIARAHSRLAGDAVGVPSLVIEGNRTAISGPLWPYESRVEVAPATEATGHAAILPSDNWRNDVALLPGSRNPAFRAKGYFDDTIGSPASGSAGTLDIRGLSDSDLRKMPWMSFNTSRTFYTSIRFDGVVARLSSEFTTQFGQFGTSTNRINTLGFSSSFRMDVGGFVSHPFSHSRVRLRAPADSSALSEECFYVGTNYFLSNSATIKLHNFLAHGVGRHFEFDAASVSNVLTLDFEKGLLERFSSDGFYWGRGTFAGTVTDVAIADPTHILINFYQTAPDMPIWLNVGAGWVSIQDRATALSTTVAAVLATLPLNRTYSYHGYLNTPWVSGTTRTLAANLVVDPKPEWFNRVPQFERDTPAGLVAADVPGFQYHATDTDFDDGTLRGNVPWDSAWISTNGQAASVSNPHILLIRGQGRYAVSGSAWTPASDTFEAPVFADSGTHPDAMQKNATNVSFNGLTFDGLVIRGNMQGIWGQGQNLLAEAITSTTFRNVLSLTGYQIAMRIDQLHAPSTFTCENMLVGWVATRKRFDNGSIPNPTYQTGANTMTLVNCAAVVQQTLDGSGTVTNGLTQNPGVITGTPKLIRAPNVSFDTFTTATTVTDGGGVVTQPILQMLTGDNPAMLDRGYFSHTGDIATWEFTEYAQTWLGWNPNTVIDNIFSGPVDFRETGAFIRETLHQEPEAHAQIVNSTAVGEEVLLTDSSGAIVRFPSHTIDPAFGDGYGLHGPFRIARDGRVFVRRSLTGINRFYRILTRQPNGSYGPIFTIDVTV